MVQHHSTQKSLYHQFIQNAIFHSFIDTAQSQQSCFYFTIIIVMQGGWKGGLDRGGAIIIENDKNKM